MNDRLRKALKIAGITLMAAAVCLIGYSMWSIFSMQSQTQNNLIEEEQLINDSNSYTGAPQASALPSGVSPTDESDLSPSDTSALSQDDISDDGSDGGDDANAPANGQATSKPKSGTSTKPVTIGILVFDRLGGRKVPVLEGVTSRDLSQGAAHHPRSSPPGGVGNCVIFGHRDTVFRGFARLKLGDSIRLEVPGSTYTYRITDMEVVNPDDSRIFHAYGQPVMTLVTCYPFNYVGAAPQRYIVIATLQ